VSSFSGWGISLLQDANQIIYSCSPQRRQEFLDKMFGKDGLRLSSVNYTIGGGDKPAHNHILQSNKIHGYLSSMGSKVILKDKHQVWLLLEAIRMGATRLHVNCSSPPYWLTKSKCTSGSCDGKSNLARENYSKFVEYIVQVLEYFKNTYKIEFDVLTPTNEPLQEWWIGECQGKINSVSSFAKKSGTSEGCHFSSKDQVVLFTLLKEALIPLKVKTVLGVSNEASVPKTLDTLEVFTKNEKTHLVDHITLHSYWGSQKDRQSLSNYSKKFRTGITMTEWGQPLDKGEQTDANMQLEGGIGLAKHICNDINSMGCREWLIQSAYPNLVEPTRGCSNLTLKKQYYVYKQFTYFINKGFAIIESQNKEHVLVACNGNKLIIVFVNDYAVERQVSFDLEGVYEPHLIDTFITNGISDFERNSQIVIQDQQIVFNAIPYTVYTFEVNIQKNQLFYCINDTLLSSITGYTTLTGSPFNNNQGRIACNREHKDTCNNKCRAVSVSGYNLKPSPKYAKFDLPKIETLKYWDCKQGDTVIETITNQDTFQEALEYCNENIPECNQECIVSKRNEDLVETFKSCKPRKRVKSVPIYILYIGMLLVICMILYNYTNGEANSSTLIFWNKL